MMQMLQYPFFVERIHIFFVTSFEKHTFFNDKFVVDSQYYDGAESQIDI